MSYDTGNDPLNEALDAMSRWWQREDGCDEDGNPVEDGDEYEDLMRLSQAVLDAADRPTSMESDDDCIDDCDACGDRCMGLQS